jgi:hypothetical protein
MFVDFMAVWSTYVTAIWYFCGQSVYFMVIWYFFGHLVLFMVIWYFLWSFGTFYGHLVLFMVIWYIFPVLVFCTEKNLATLLKFPDKDENNLISIFSLSCVAKLTRLLLRCILVGLV